MYLMQARTKQCSECPNEGNIYRTELFLGIEVFMKCCVYAQAAFIDLNSKKICVPLSFSSFIVPPNCCVRSDIS